MSLAEEARTVRQRIAERLRELEPLVREYHELQQLAAEMGVESAQPAAASGPQPAASERQPAASERQPAVGEPPPAAGEPQPADSEPQPAASRPPRQRRTGSRRGSGTSSALASPGDDVSHRVLEAVRADPGKTVGDYAEVLGVAATALYRPVREMTNDGTIVKRGRELYPT